MVSSMQLYPMVLAGGSASTATHTKGNGSMVKSVGMAAKYTTRVSTMKGNGRKIFLMEMENI